mgnify:CR=1 FL=1
MEMIEFGQGRSGMNNIVRNHIVEGISPGIVVLLETVISRSFH